MKKFHFKLDKLLSYKDQLLENGLMILATLNAEMQRLNDRLRALAEEVLRSRRSLAEKQAEGELTPTAYQIHFRYEDFLKKEIEETEGAAAKLAVKIEQQIEVIRGLRLETKSLEILKESKLKDYRKEEMKAHEQMIDEFVNTSRLQRQAAQGT
ncbi:MAG: flagellar FliJ family protein [Clostridiales Family XIII bacterium]|nr:flagellar FliJ family protein [Clostridiales Family XIII bacterium]